MLASAKSQSSQDMGNNIILLGLGIQVIFFAFFMVVTIIFHIRISKRPTTASLSIAAPWQRLIWVLYFASVLIMVRSVFRMMEYAQGSEGELMQKETYVYVLDALLMFLVAAVFVAVHPGGILVAYRKLDYDGELASTSDTYPMVNNGGQRAAYP